MLRKSGIKGHISHESPELCHVAISSYNIIVIKSLKVVFNGNPLGIGCPQFKIECQLAIKTELEIPGGPMIMMIGIH